MCAACGRGPCEYETDTEPSEADVMPTAPTAGEVARPVLCERISDVAPELRDVSMVWAGEDEL